MDALSIEEVRIKRGRMIVTVRVAADREMTDSKIAALAIQRHPTIVDHACINDCGPKFDAVIADTSIAHLLEHLTIAEQLEEMSQDQELSSLAGKTLLVGTTKRIDASDAFSTFRVEVSFVDDLIAVRSLMRAAGFLNSNLRY